VHHKRDANEIYEKLEAIKAKKRGVSNNACRPVKMEYFHSMNLPDDNDIPKKMTNYGFSIGATFKTPNKGDVFFRKKRSNFNENNRRPIMNLEIPKRGDHNTNSASMSSIKSEEGKTNMRKYIKKDRFNQTKSHFTRKSVSSVKQLSSQPMKNKLLHFKDSFVRTPKVHDSSPSVNSERNAYSRQRQKINIKKINNLECQESNNFASRRKKQSVAIFPGHIRIKEENQNKMDQSEYDEGQMNERLDGFSIDKRHEKDIDKHNNDSNKELNLIGTSIIL
jgi:hypothetical protein